MTSATRLEGACITREQFLLRETRVVARLRLEGLANDQIVERVVAENLFQYPTGRMLRNITTVCTRRLVALGSDALVRAIAEGEEAVDAYVESIRKQLMDALAECGSVRLD